MGSARLRARHCVAGCLLEVGARVAHGVTSMTSISTPGSAL